MTAIIVILECLTNLHAGNGDVNYNIIDNEVERDPVTGYPVINASGVKGALRKHFKGNPHENEWFGKDAPGRLKFLGANMLAIPLRASKGTEAFYRVSTDLMLQKYNEFCTLFLNKHDNDLTWEKKTDEKNESIEVETFPLSKKTTFAVDKDSYDIYKIENQNLRKTELPVIARNKLEDGISDNLWYEEVVPHESIFYFPVFADEKDEKLLKAFTEALNQAKVIQFGGNASIGYGLCRVTVKEEIAHEQSESK